MESLQNSALQSTVLLLLLSQPSLVQQLAVEMAPANGTSLFITVALQSQDLFSLLNCFVEWSYKTNFLVAFISPILLTFNAAALLEYSTRKYWITNHGKVPFLHLFSWVRCPFVFPI